MRREPIALRCGSAHAPGGGYETDQLRKLSGADAHGEHGDILVPGHRRSTSATNVLGVVQQTFSVEGDFVETQLPVAGHARAAWDLRLHTPARVAHSSVIKGLDGDAAIDHRDEI